jgi:hypothetical protein
MAFAIVRQIQPIRALTARRCVRHGYLNDITDECRE